MTGIVAGFFVSLGLASLLSLTIMHAAWGGLYAAELRLGLAFAVLNGVVALVTHGCALGGTIGRCFAWAAAGDAIRMAAAAAVIFGRRWLGAEHLAPLALTVAVSYLVFMVNDVWVLSAPRFRASPGKR